MGIWKSKDHAVHEIKAEELRGRLSRPGLVVVNVLDQKYYDDCSIPGSIHIPVAEIEIKTSEWPKNKEIVVYCAHLECDSSRKAARKLMKHGFTNVRAYEGGIKEWKKKGWPTEGPCMLSYLHD